jgi:integrase
MRPANPIKIKNKNGTVSYRVQITNAITGKRESKTFSSARIAREWAEKRYGEIEYEGVHGKPATLTIRDALEEYIRLYAGSFGRSKNYDLKRLRTYPIAKLAVAELTPMALIEHCMERGQEAKPQTVKNDIVWLRTVLNTITTSHNIQFDPSVFSKASIVLRKQKIIANSNTRTRLPSFREIVDLGKRFRKGSYLFPMYDVYMFALFSGRRSAEITRLAWADNNDAKKTGLVTQVKHPTKKESNDKRFKYDDCAWRIVQRQPRYGRLIFPFNSKTVEMNFQRACKELDIKDLHFHDLRGHAITRWVKMGFGLEKIMHYSLHDDIKSLMRYVKTKPEDI